MNSHSRTRTGHLRRTGLAAVALSAFLVLAACSSGNGAAAPSSSGSAASGSGSASTAAPASSSAAPASSSAATSAASSAATSAGSSAASASGSATGSASGSAAAGGADHVSQELAKYSKLPTFTAPGPSFDAKKLMAGKTILSIGVNNADQFVGVIQNSMKQVAQQAGFKFEVYTNQGSLNEWVRGMQTGINEKVSVIDLLAGIDPSLLAPQIKQAAAAGIKVVVSDAFDINQPGPNPPLPIVRADVPYALAAQLDADWIIQQSQGKADVLVIGSSDVKSSPYMVKAIDNEFDKYCSGCKHKDIDITVANWASQTQKQVQAALGADPKIDYILPVFDSQSQFIVPAITAAGMSGKVGIVTYDGTPFVLKMMQDGNTVKMDVGENLDWIAKAIMDQDMRVAAGLPPVKDLNAPLYLFTKANVNTAGTPPQNSTGYGNAYKCGYAHLWQLSGSC